MFLAYWKAKNDCFSNIYNGDFLTFIEFYPVLFLVYFSGNKLSLDSMSVSVYHYPFVTSGIVIFYQY